MTARRAIRPRPSIEPRDFFCRCGEYATFHRMAQDQHWCRACVPPDFFHHRSEGQDHGSEHRND